MGIAPDGFHGVASPLARSRETMEIVRREVGLDPAGYRTDDRLREISYGELEGMTHEEIEAERPDLYRLLRTEKWTFLPPGGENYPHLAARVGRALSEIAAPAIVVAHGGVFRAIKSLIEAGPKDGIEEFFVPQDKVFVLENGREDWR
jgi:probable phosphoglycerate mutase